MGSSSFGFRVNPSTLSHRYEANLTSFQDVVFLLQQEYPGLGNPDTKLVCVCVWGGGRGVDLLGMPCVSSNPWQMKRVLLHATVEPYASSLECGESE